MTWKFWRKYNYETAKYFKVDLKIRLGTCLKIIVQEPAWTSELDTLWSYLSLVGFLPPQCFSASNLNIRRKLVCCPSACYITDHELFCGWPLKKKDKNLRADLLKILFNPIPGETSAMRMRTMNFKLRKK